MSTATHAHDHDHGHADAHEHHGPPAGFTRWMYTTNHKDVGILYLVGSMYFGFIGAILILLVRVQLLIPTCAPGTTSVVGGVLSACWASPTQTFLSASAFNQAVTLHGPICGAWLSTRRLLRCHPWAPGGPDPVPPRRRPVPGQVPR